MIQWNYQLTKQNWPACELGILQPFNRFSFAFGSKKLPGLSRNGPLETSLTRSFTGYHEAAQKDWVKIPFQNSPIEEFDTIDLVSRATIRG